MGALELVEVAVYRRRVGAGLERVWENVLDWEHLPWLHRSSFSSVDLVELRADGWRAQVGLGSLGAADVDVRCDRERNRYLTATRAGTGAGTEIWTTLEPVSAAETAIEVRFLAPVTAEHASAVGDYYVGLYARLWDEDERMMRHRQAVLSTRQQRLSIDVEVDLGPRDEVFDRVPFAVDAAGGRWLVFAVEDAILARPALCPHALGPLDEGEMCAERVRCPWHGYEFDLRSGQSADGRALRLGDARPAVQRGKRLYLSFPASPR